MKKIIVLLLASAFLTISSCTPADILDDASSSQEVMSNETSLADSTEESKEETIEESSEYAITESSESQADSVLTFGDYSYKLNNSVATLIAYTGSDETITVPETVDGHTVSAIAEDCFADNATVKAITVGDTVVNIGDGAFRNCSSLESVTIGNSVAVINISAFDVCPKLSSINVRSANMNFVSDNGILFNSERTALLRCPPAYAFSEGYKLPDTVVSIGDSAYEGCNGLTALTLPENCLLGKRSFFHCMNLTSVTFSNGIKVLPERCFFGCALLKQINIPDGVTEIGDYAFFGCVFAETLSLPKSLVTIADTAFECCTSLKNIKVEGDCAKKWYEDWKEKNKTE